MIQPLSLKDSGYDPGEVLTHNTDEFTHITITYNISGERHKVDQNIENAIENTRHLVKVPYVNTTLYWQINLGDRDWSKDKLVSEAEVLLENKLKEIFLGDDFLYDTTVTVFCMVGNLRAFAFELS
ncbi:hypothetical protein CGG78_23985 [Vibrio parahaemolyticus]|uniref:hypothetical protein n=1 Tax=Vibrio parahaemolyticus TaxID=670 RepID=UPI00112023C1|nr:hypothetical protein [Vibrio parahaemolyticus]MBE3884802.1 hypothetical protein [Vibrio parahaemolyticus]MBE4178361.1 hypothetical protein [Vibrio parahaemolyticus]MBE4236573.1 hypothetical protein [Vibrio parahaemolyticus]MBE4263506.1 hypothetical protein [Vibrio parahaemolyticus]MBE4282139.1 hypothetical protein [Vibrio parahaemolyticus]